MPFLVKMNFNFEDTTIFRAVRLERMIIFKYTDFLFNLFLGLFIIFAGLVGFSLLGLLSFKILFVKLGVLFLSLALLFWNLSLFVKYKIKNPPLPGALKEAVDSPQNFNLAEWFSLEMTKLLEKAVKFCQRKNIALDSICFFYWGLKTNPEIQLICFRLGMEIKTLQENLKNYLEKIPRLPSAKETSFSFFFSRREATIDPKFEELVLEMFRVASERKKERVGEKEFLVALARKEDFFKKILREYDLKREDVENITQWLDSYEERLRIIKEFWRPENLARWGSVGSDWAFGYTLNLDEFSIDWRDIVSKQLSKQIIGHTKEIETLEMILARSQFSNALIIGEPGTGRKSIVEALAQRCYLGESLPELNNRRVVELDLTRLIAAIPDFELVEKKLDQIFYEATSAGNIILVIDDLHKFVGRKTQAVGTIDISGILSRYLAIPSFKFVAITTYDGLHRDIESNRSFVEYFRKIEVSEVSEQETIQILQSYALSFERKYKILILYPAIREIVKLTGRYMPSLFFPKKAIDILDEAVVYLQTLREKVLQPHHIVKIISQKTEIPLGKIETKEKEILLNLENLLHQRIIDQEEAVRQISIAMRRGRAGIGSQKRPFGSFLFLGPTGVGKTETSKALAQIYFGSEEKMIRLDMSEFQAISDIPRLIGGVIPVEIPGLLTTAVRENPFSLVLLDEIEKAHPDILNLFLQVLDEGHLTDGQGRRVVFSNTIIICTSNAGADIIFKEAQEGRRVDKDKLLAILFERKIFRPEFINRFDATIIFNPLTQEHLLKIAELQLSNLKKNLAEKEIDFVITQALKERIVMLSYKPEFGAREMRRVIQDKIENVIAQHLISEKIKKGDKIEIHPENFEVLILSRDSE